MHAARALLVSCLVLTLATPVGLAAEVPPKPAPKAGTVPVQPTTAQVRGVLLDTQGLPAKGYQVGLKSAAGDLYTSAPTGVDGSFVLPGLPAATYRVVAYAPDGTEFPVVSREVQLKGGQTERIEIRLSESDKGSAPGRAGAGVPPAKSGGLLSTTVGKVGVVVAGAFAVGLLLSRSSDNNNQSPVSPSQP